MGPPLPERRVAVASDADADPGTSTDPGDHPAPSDPQAASTGAVASGSRAAGTVFALGYLLGLVPGPVVAVVGGLALITFGRSLLLDRRDGRVAAAAFAVATVTFGVGALRWDTLELAELRGVQAVLGPTVLVGPQRVAVAAGLAAGASLVALAVWSSLGPRLDRGDRAWLSVEAVVGALLTVTVFFDPVRLIGETAGSPLLEWGLWSGAALATAAVTLALAWLLARGGPKGRGGALGVGACAAAAAAAVMVASL